MVKPITNIIFDFGGILVDLCPQVSFQEFKALGVHDIEEMLNPYRQKGLFYQLEMGLLGADEFAHALSEHAGRTISTEDVRRALVHFVRPPRPERFEYIAALRPRYKVYVLSNSNPYMMGYACSAAFLPNSKGLMDYIDGLFASHLMHKMKPDAEIYEEMIRQTGMDPAESLFIDDSKDNIAAAAALGFQTLLGENGKDWRPLLSQRLQS